MNPEESTLSSLKARGKSGATIVSIITYLGAAALFGLVVLLAIFLLRSPCSSAKLSQVNADFQSIHRALDMYKLIGGRYPTTAQGLKALIEKPLSDPVPAKWQQTMKMEPLDPWKSPYVYKFPGSKDPPNPELISKGPDGIEGNEDDLSSQDR